MKKTKIFAIIMVISLCLSACGGANSGAIEESSLMTESQPSIADDVVMSNAGVIQDNNNEGDDLAGDHDGLPEVGIDQDVDWGTETETTAEAAESEADEVEQTDGVDESDVDEFVENPGVHNGYLHEVGGARFYTEHDLSQWLRPNEKYPQHLDFDIGQMIFDLYGGNMVGSNAYVYKLGEIAFSDPDKNNNNLYHTVKIVIRPDNESSEFWCQEIKMYNCPGPYITNCYSILEDYHYLVHKDMAPIILYSFEQILRDPQYDAVGNLNLDGNFVCYHYCN